MENESTYNDKVFLREHLEAVIKLKVDAISEKLILKTEAIKESLELKIVALSKSVDLKNSATQQALDLAGKSLEHRLDNMNEFRKQIERAESTYITRNEFNGKFEKIIDDIKMLISSKDKLEGKASQKSVTLALAISIIGGGIALFSLVIRFFI